MIRNLHIPNTHMTRSDDTSLTMTPKDQAAILAVFDEGLKLKKELAEIKRIQPKKREELRQRAKRFHKLLRDNEQILSRMFGDVEDDTESMSVVESLLDELRQIYARLGVDMKMAA
jgi:hypothetical protein